jgi:hypothetical protein
MTIKAISEIKQGHLVEVKSDSGGIEPAPLTFEVNTTGETVTSADDEHRGYSFKLDMKNYIGTIDIAGVGDKPHRTIHQFSK